MDFILTQMVNTINICSLQFSSTQGKCTLKIHVVTAVKTGVRDI